MEEIINKEQEPQKITLMDGNKPAELSLGTLYEQNQTLVHQTMHTRTKKKIKEMIKDNVAQLQNDTAYMMLCRELNDYTIFIYSDDTEEFEMALYDCITNRGGCYSIDINDDHVLEIWLKINDKPHLYYLFDCDNCIIQC